MNTSIAFVSQMPYRGKISRTFPEMRIPSAFIAALDADHYNILDLDDTKRRYDHVIVEVAKGKELRDILYEVDLISQLRRLGNKIWWLQEGPVWVYQDMPMHHQIWHFNLLNDVDAILVQNSTDESYIQGLFPNKEIDVLQSVMIEDTVKEAVNVTKEDKVMIGGNFCRWYGGFDSYIVAQYFDIPMVIPSMGRRVEGEEQLSDLTHLPYMKWNEWIYELAKCKYAVHLMPTFAAGTFALNCGYLGIPCIGYADIDTQRTIHPYTSIKLGDLIGAVKLAQQLRSDEIFYENCVNIAKELYKTFYSENAFLKYTEQLFGGRDD